jgi:acetyl-CoA C-acetyltransferase
MSQPISRFGRDLGHDRDRRQPGPRLPDQPRGLRRVRRHEPPARGQAWAAGKFDDELVPVSVPQKKGDPIVFAQDEGVRADATAKASEKLRALEKDGVVTPATPASRTTPPPPAWWCARQAGRAEPGPDGWFVSWAAAGCDPSRMGIGPVPA